MLDIVVFVVALAMGQVLGALIMTMVGIKLMTNKRFIKKYTKVVTEVANELVEENF